MGNPSDMLIQRVVDIQMAPARITEHAGPLPASPRHCITISALSICPYIPHSASEARLKWEPRARSFSVIYTPAAQSVYFTPARTAWSALVTTRRRTLPGIRFNTRRASILPFFCRQFLVGDTIRSGLGDVKQKEHSGRTLVKQHLRRNQVEASPQPRCRALSCSPQ